MVTDCACDGRPLLGVRADLPVKCLLHATAEDFKAIRPRRARRGRPQNRKGRRP